MGRILSCGRSWRRALADLKAGADGVAVLKRCLRLGLLDRRVEEMRKVVVMLGKGGAVPPVPLLERAEKRFGDDPATSGALSLLFERAGDRAGALRQARRAWRGGADQGDHSGSPGTAGGGAAVAGVTGSNQ